MNEREILEAVAEGEAADWEFKSAKGGFPASVWETYSAMANTNGGPIVLGVGQTADGFDVEELKNPSQYLKTCFDTVNNRGKVSINLLMGSAARLVTVESKQVLVIQVPRASRRQRPVYVGQNPLEGTYRRNCEQDPNFPLISPHRALQKLAIFR
jgi:ATP-dependent DNA helicase RecG